jgi:hypothetical protein
MRFAKYVFTGAGIWGIVVLTPLFFLYDLSGQEYPPPDTYPHFFYGFIGVAMAWQFVFLVIGSNPLKYRLLMLPSMLEKLAFIVPCAMLYQRGRLSAHYASAAIPDLVLGMLFVAAFARTRSRHG